nr:uracil-DNA glycosylase family protein [Shewanella mesophila]
MQDIDQLVSDLRACRMCAAHLPKEARPIIQISPHAKIVIAGQAPGAVANSSGIPFDDASGERLRQWLGVSHQQFYDETLFAILPMAFCYPGKGTSGDKPPIKACAQKWRATLLEHLTNVELTIVIGQYAQDYHFNDKQTVTERVRDWRNNSESLIALPHPSPRNNIWLKRHAWFELELLPEVKQRVARILASHNGIAR